MNFDVRGFLLKNIMTGPMDPEAGFEVLKKRDAQPASVCGKVLKPSDTGIKCLDCEDDHTCLICRECYEQGNHEGHRVIIQRGCSGMCDCGDPEAWDPKGFCSDHSGQTDIDISTAVQNIDPNLAGNIRVNPCICDL